ncbi:ligand-binding SRPBCC domain-containing protein [Ulvibacter sp. MAR_2010_11]|uniref:SRPBCC family protein n=1 Tax=Ulvibacter sp. MAR_2010_11 TaxID=1250229 RepID=UPI000C2B55C6|nr:SRPBCC family protein [Ulvibacter sp. MAR_2010_11]PKA82042.1 ligand-binding SRPBCC domain-containing protein [Ulvibacter sp. MAR_2010_11]
MGFYQFYKQQLVHQPVEKLWDFISRPENLKKITPKKMGFDITSENLPETMYSGMIVSYIVAPILGIKTTWVTEITHVKPREYFVDEQRVGPYKLWHHQHFLESVPEGTLMRDIVSYQPPYGILGSIANQLFIKRKLNEIFEYRSKVLTQLFNH